MQAVEQTLPRTHIEIKLTPKQELNFWKKVNKDGPTMPCMETSCWMWAAGKSSNGYGTFCLSGKTVRSPRVSWVLANGPIPHNGSYHGFCVCHRCDNPLCVNPTHLFLGLHAANVADKVSKNRQAKGDANGARTRPETRARGEKQGRSKLTAEQIIQIRSLYATGRVFQRQLAVEFGVSGAAIGYIVRRKAWAHI